MTRIRIVLPLLLAALLAAPAAQAQPTRADTLRGSIGPARAWWDVAFYDLNVRVSPADSSISGFNAITYRVLQPELTRQLCRPSPADRRPRSWRMGRRHRFRRGDPCPA